MNYLQKKKQAIIMMLAAQIVKTAQGYPVTVNDCESGTAVDYTVWGNTVTGKNLISYPYIDTTKTVKGITFTDNGDGTVTANGTATGEAVFKMSVYTLKKGVTYYLSGCPKGGSMSTYYFHFRGYDQDVGYGVKIPVTYDFTNNTEIVIKKGAVLNNLIFKPQLELGETATEYEPYTESYVGDKFLASDNTYKYKIPIVNSGDNDREDALINIYLDKPLKKGESVNFGADNLPGLQLFEGSNVITADTAVKPEKIVIDYYEKG